MGNAKREAQTISSYSGLVWTPEGAGGALFRVNLSEGVAQHLVHARRRVSQGFGLANNPPDPPLTVQYL